MDVTQKKKRKKRKRELIFIVIVFVFHVFPICSVRKEGKNSLVFSGWLMANVFVSLIKSTSCQEIGTCDILWIAKRLGYYLQVVICIHQQNVLRLSPSVPCKPKAEAWCIPSHD